MPKLKNSPPKYRHHKARDLAVVTLGGKDFYLGQYDSVLSRYEYDRLVGEWMAAGRPASWNPSQQASITVSELCAAYYHDAQQYYRKDGESTGTAEGMRPALRLIRKYYGDTLVSDFGPLALKALQQRMIEQRLSRRYINDNVDRIRRMFRWGVSEQIVPGDVIQCLATVRNLAKGRSEARETDPISAVPDSVVHAILPYLSTIVADMVRFQRLTGCRPSEVCLVRPRDVDQSGDVWIYRPMTHKTEHRGKERRVFVGPEAQLILDRYLIRNVTSFCFSPKAAEAERLSVRNAARVTPRGYGNARISTTNRARRRAPGPRYTKDSYRRAIQRACDKAGIVRWSPNQLRHSFATEVRSKHGLEAAQILLGHSSADVTQIYAQSSVARGIEVARQLGQTC